MRRRGLRVARVKDRERFRPTRRARRRARDPARDSWPGFHTAIGGGASGWKEGAEGEDSEGSWCGYCFGSRDSDVIYVLPQNVFTNIYSSYKIQIWQSISIERLYLTSIQEIKYCGKSETSRNNSKSTNTPPLQVYDDGFISQSTFKWTWLSLILLNGIDVFTVRNVIYLNRLNETLIRPWDINLLYGQNFFLLNLNSPTWNVL